MYKTYIYTYTDEIGKKKKTKQKPWCTRTIFIILRCVYVYLGASVTLHSEAQHRLHHLSSSSSNFFFLNPILHRSFRFLLLRKKKKFPILRTHCDFSSQAQPFALIYALPFRFSSMFDGYAVFYLVMFILSLSPRVGTGDDQRGDEIMKKKKKRKRKKKDTSSTFRWKRNRMERNNGDRDDRLFRRFFHHRLVIVTAANNFVARSSSQRWAILLRLSHYFFFFPPLPLIFLLFSFLGACRTMYSRCQR